MPACCCVRHVRGLVSNPGLVHALRHTYVAVQVVRDLVAIPLGGSGVPVEQRSAFHLLWLMAAEIHTLASAMVSLLLAWSACSGVQQACRCLQSSTARPSCYASLLVRTTSLRP